MTLPILRCSLEPVRSGAPDAELIVLGPSLGTTTSLWAPLIAELSREHRVLRFDLPGHGSSPRTDRPFSLAELAEAVLATVDAVGGGAFHYAGVSMGGAIGLQLALDHGGRLRSLIDICSDARIGSPEGWESRARQAREQGTASLVATSAERWFAPGFLDRDPVLSARALSELLDVDDVSYALCCSALAGFDLQDRLDSPIVPALILAGEHDVATPPADLRDLAARLGADFALVPGAGHLPTLENPEVVADAMMPFISNIASWSAPWSAAVVPASEGGARPDDPRAADSARASGERIRREVLGDAHVDAAIGKTTPETADFQDFITRYAWGEIWSRPGLDRRTRSFLTLACLVTGGHETELKLHVLAALRNGLSRSEIAEALLHTAVYAGVPAANSAFAAAAGVFAELDED